MRYDRSIITYARYVVVNTFVTFDGCVANRIIATTAPPFTAFFLDSSAQLKFKNAKAHKSLSTSFSWVDRLMRVTMRPCWTMDK